MRLPELAHVGQSPYALVCWCAEEQTAILIRQVMDHFLQAAVKADLTGAPRPQLLKKVPETVACPLVTLYGNG